MSADGRRLIINTNTLFQMADIFRFRWDPPTLACLADQPMRFRALGRRLGADIGDRVEDNTLTRSLIRLRRAGLVSAQRTTIGGRTVPLYRITDEGRIRLAHYQALAFMYQELTMPNGKDKRQPDSTTQNEGDGAGPEH